MAGKVIPIMSQTIKTNKMPDISGFIQAMKDMGARVSVQGNKVVIDFRGGERDGRALSCE